MKCDKIQEQLAGLVYDEVEPMLKQELMSHLEACPSCREQYDDMREAAGVLQGAFDSLPKLKLDDARRAAVMSADVAPEPKLIQRPSIFQATWFRAAMTAAAAFVVCGVATVMLSKDNTKPHRIAQGEFPEAPAKTEAKKAEAADEMYALRRTEDVLGDGKVYGAPSAVDPSTAAKNSEYKGKGLKDDKAAEEVAIAYDSKKSVPKNKWMNGLAIDGHVEGEKPEKTSKVSGPATSVGSDGTRLALSSETAPSTTFHNAPRATFEYHKPKSEITTPLDVGPRGPSRASKVEMADALRKPEPAPAPKPDVPILGDLPLSSRLFREEDKKASGKGGDGYLQEEAQKQQAQVRQQQGQTDQGKSNEDAMMDLGKTYKENSTARLKVKEAKRMAEIEWKWGDRSVKKEKEAARAEPPAREDNGLGMAAKPVSAPERKRIAKKSKARSMRSLGRERLEENVEAEEDLADVEVDRDEGAKDRLARSKADHEVHRREASKLNAPAEPAEGREDEQIVKGGKVGKEAIAGEKREERLKKALDTGTVAASVVAEPVKKSVFVPIPVNPFVMTKVDRLSTFALDTDTASYSLMRKYVSNAKLPPQNSVRMEEYVNHFDYNYATQAHGTFSVHTEAAASPFGKGLVLMKVGVKAKVIGRDGRRPSHLVFAVDTSGSMARRDRMPLLQAGLNALVDKLDPNDRVSLITYGRNARLILENQSAKDTEKIKSAITNLQCGESTHLANGVRLAYQMARRHYVAGRINSVILCSDGMANLGPQDAESITGAVAKYRRQGISFNSVGFGMGNYNDSVLEKLANRGDGSYLFVDTLEQAKKTFADEMGKRLNIVARNAKIQVEFNPDAVRRYRLIGYENRKVADKDFRNDKVDAGEVGSGQSATALYEIELNDPSDLRTDLGTVFVRYENVETNKVEEISSRLVRSVITKRSVEQNPHFYLAAAAAEFAEILRESEHARDGSLDRLQFLTEKVAAQLPLDQKVQELRKLIHRAKGLPRATE